MSNLLKTLYHTFNAGDTSYTFTDDAITNDSLIDVYFNEETPYTIYQTGNTIEIAISPSMTEIGCALYINNVDSFDLPISSNDVVIGDVSLTERLSQYSGDINGLQRVTRQHTNDISGINDDITDLAERVNDCFTSVSNGKNLVATAITDKGVQTVGSDTFETMATNIRSISGGGSGDLPTRSCDIYRYPSYYGRTSNAHTCDIDGTIVVTLVGNYFNAPSYITKNGVEVEYSIYHQGDMAWSPLNYFLAVIPVKSGDVISAQGGGSSGGSCWCTMCFFY